MTEPIEISAQELPTLIARLRAEGRRASTITAIGTNGYRVTIAGAQVRADVDVTWPVPKRKPMFDHTNILNGFELAALCQRLKEQGKLISSIRAFGTNGYAVSVVADDRAQRLGSRSESGHALTVKRCP